MDGWREEEENRPTAAGGVEEAESLGWKHPRFGDGAVGGGGGGGLVSELRRGRENVSDDFSATTKTTKNRRRRSLDEEIGENPPQREGTGKQQKLRGGEMEGAALGISACCGRAIVSGREFVACLPTVPTRPHVRLPRRQRRPNYGRKRSRKNVFGNNNGGMKRMLLWLLAPSALPPLPSHRLPRSMRGGGGRGRT